MQHDRLAMLIETRTHRPEAIAEAAAARRRPESAVGEGGTTMIIAADHPARGMLKAGARGMDNEGKDANGRVMAQIASRMVDRDMHAVAEYVAGLH